MGLTVVYGRQELIEVGDGVVRAGSRLGMVLDSEHRQLTVADPLNRPIVQVHVRNLESGSSSDAGLITLDSEAVILRRDQYASGSHLLDRMISTPVPVWELCRRATK